MFVLAGALACGTGGGPSADGPAAAPTIYKWVDANGIAHYTTDLARVPRSVRGSVRALGAPSGERETLAARDAAASPAPQAEPPPEWDVGDAPLPPPSPPPPPARGRDAWAATDRPFDLPPGAAPEEPAPAPPELASAEPPSAEPELSPQDREAQRRALDARIAALQAEISSDENALKGFLAVPAPDDPAEIAYDQSFREVAERLPKRLAELRSLQDERAQLEPR